MNERTVLPSTLVNQTSVIRFVPTSVGSNHDQTEINERFMMEQEYEHSLTMALTIDTQKQSINKIQTSYFTTY